MDNPGANPTDFSRNFWFNSKLLRTPKTLKEFMTQYKNKKEIMEKKEKKK